MSRYNGGQRRAEIDYLEEEILQQRRRVIEHPIYAALDSAPAIRAFMEHHVFAVWDFMSLLKSLQRNLTCVELPWIPAGPTDSRRLINDIVLVEESDEWRDGFISHFELYVAGMSEAFAIQGRLVASLSPGYGFIGFLVAWLAGGDAVGIVVMAFLFPKSMPRI